MRKTFPKGFIFEDKGGHFYKCVSDLGEKGLALEDDRGELTIIAKSCVSIRKSYTLNLE